MADYLAPSSSVDDAEGGKISPRLWMDRVTVAKKSQEQWEDVSGAKRFEDEYNGKFDAVTFYGMKGQIPVPPINEVFAYVQADIAATNNRDPYISVNPKTGTVAEAKLLETALNQEWRTLRTKEELELEIVDKDLIGHGWHKVGMGIESEGEGDRLKIVKEGLYSMRVAWRDIVWNIGAQRPPKDCVWMAQRIVRPLMDVRRKYPNAAKLDGSPNPEVDTKTYQSALYKDDIKVAVLWEIWDSESKMIYLIAEGLEDKYLSDPKPWPEYLGEFPFLMYWDFITANKPRPMSAIAPWEPQILEKMVILASAVNHVKRWNRQMLVKQGVISPEALDKYERGDDGAIIEHSGSGEIDKHVKILDYGQLPADFYLIMDRLSGIENNVNGQPEFNRGGVTKTSTRTIGELELINQGAKGRVDRKIDRFETHMENIARHMLAHMKANYDVPMLVTVTGDTPEEVITALGNHYNPETRTVEFTPAEIQGEFDVDVKAGSTLPLDKMTKMRILETVMNTLGQVSSEGVSPLLNTIITELLDGFDIKSLEEAYRSEQEQEAEASQKEQQSLDAQEAKDRTQAAKNFANADKTMAETDLLQEQAIMGPIESEAPVLAGGE